MKGMNRDANGSGSTSSITDFNRSGDSSTNDSCFDVSQYAFFGGKDVVEEVELGGLEDDGVLDKTGLEWLDDLDYPFSFTNNEDKGEGGILESLSNIDDLTSTFNKLNRVVAQPRNVGVIGDRASSSRGSSSTLDWSQEVDTPENAEDNKRWWSQPYTHTTIFPDSKQLHRTSSYPQPLQQQHQSIKPNYPSPVGTQPQLLSRHSSLPFPHSTNITPYFPVSPISTRSQNQWLNFNQATPYPNIIQQLSLPSAWDSPTLLSHALHPQLSLPDELFISQPRSYQHCSQLQSRFLSSNPITQRNKPSRKGRQNTRFSSDTSSQNSDSTTPQFRSKYMSAEEIGSILKLQHASSHKHDPYTDDYYHQACLAKRLNRPFHPSSIKDSIRKPYRLLELDTSTSTPKPLEQEPAVVARTIVEDGFRILLEVDDINRFLHFTKTTDGGSHLIKKRQMLLEGLLTSLHLVDPFSHSVDDMIFLRLTSLSKGRGLITRFLALLHPGSEVARIICMAIFRHLRFLFGAPPTEATSHLSKSVVTSVGNMALGALSGCLAAVVCSSEQPPLRPLGCPSGDGASVVIMAVLDRANDLISATNSCNMPNLPLWRASFDAFFVLMTKYCVCKYESIVKSTMDTSEAVGKEMPVEILRSSIAHTNARQRQQLLDFVHRSVSVRGWYDGSGKFKDSMTSESVPG